MKATTYTPAWVILATGTLLLGAFFGIYADQPKPAQEGKLYHIGLVWLKEPGNAEHRRKIIDAAHAFAKEIPEVESLSVGQPASHKSPLVDGSYDVCLMMRLHDKAAMDRYGEHPVHQMAAREVFLPLSSKIVFYDFIAE